MAARPGSPIIAILSLALGIERTPRFSASGRNPARPLPRSEARTTRDTDESQDSAVWTGRWTERPTAPDPGSVMRVRALRESCRTFFRSSWPRRSSFKPGRSASIPAARKRCVDAWCPGILRVLGAVPAIGRTFTSPTTEPHLYAVIAQLLTCDSTAGPTSGKTFTLTKPC